jgi:hypothetical protein
MLRKFAGLGLVVFGGLAAWRFWYGQTGAWTISLAAAAVVVGVAGLVRPALVRPIYSGWMMAAFPIGWTVSHIALGVVPVLTRQRRSFTRCSDDEPGIRLQAPQLAAAAHLGYEGGLPSGDT